MGRGQLQEKRFSPTLFPKEIALLSKLSNRLHAWAKGWLILSVLAAFFLFTAVIWPLLSRRLPASAEMESLDGPVFYTPDEIFSIVESWGAVGRTQQMWFHLTWDVVVPVLAMLLFGLSLSWLFQRGFEPGSKLQKMNLLALGGTFDLLENVFIVTMIIAYPAQPVAVAWLKTFSTTIKYGFALVWIPLLLIGLVKAAVNRFKVRKPVKE